MGTDLHYVPGEFYRICERTGFATRARRTRKEWDGHIVRDQSWEPRQPQDLVRGVYDDQTVPEARPRPADTYLPAETSLTAAAAIGALTLAVASTVNFKSGDTIAVVLDDGGIASGVFLVQLAAPPALNVLTLAKPLPWTAAAGNQVRDYTYQPPSQIAANYPEGN